MEIISLCNKARMHLFKWPTYTKPLAATWEEWGSWHEDTYNKYRAQYIIFEKVLPKMHRMVTTVCGLTTLLESTETWVYNVANCSTVMRTGFKLGSYHEIEEIMLYANFNTLVSYVERELASFNVACHSMRGDKQSLWYRSVSRIPFVRYFVQPNPQEGIEYLKWRVSVSEGNKDNSAQAILDLYNWWTVQRPARVDEYTASGFEAFQAKLEAKYGAEFKNVFGYTGKLTAAERKEYDAVCNKMMKLEDAYYKEDDKKLTELVKLRGHLWS